MACKQMKCSKNGATSSADFPDDLIIEILSLLPVKSVCRFKCVSWLWYRLISQDRKKLPKTLSGFFYPKYRLNDEDDLIRFPTFDGISGDQEQLFPDSSLPFLTGYKQILPEDCCNGLIFCLCWKDSIDEADYVVCNPVTEEWVVLPDAGHESNPLAYCLGSDAAMSPHFHVFQILEGDEDSGYISGVNIYSSETGVWSYKENGWGDNEIRIVNRRIVFFNGMMHLLLLVNLKGGCIL